MVCTLPDASSGARVTEGKWFPCGSSWSSGDLGAEHRGHRAAGRRLIGLMTADVLMTAACDHPPHPPGPVCAQALCNAGSARQQRGFSSQTTEAQRRSACTTRIAAVCLFPSPEPPEQLCPHAEIQGHIGWFSLFVLVRGQTSRCCSRI